MVIIEEEEQADLITAKMKELQLPDQRAKKNPRAIARRYQLMLCEKAKKENVIICLETGTGKTLIAVLLMLEFADRIKKPGRNVCVFLAPTVNLVQQQAEVIQEHSDFKVGLYFGEAKHSSNAHQNWLEELEKHEVLVMTPDILLHNLHHCFMKMELIELLIFDECHHAQKRHSYAQIMKEFFIKDNGKHPRIFGMTASPVKGKGGSNQLEYAKVITTLEQLLDAKVYTVDDKSELELFVPSPVMKICYYENKNDLRHGPIMYCKNKLEDCRVQHISRVFSCCNEENAEVYKHDFKANDKKTRSINRFYGDLVYCLAEIGLWGAQKAGKILLAETTDNVNQDNVDNHSPKSFLRDALLILDSSFDQDRMNDNITKNALMEPFLSSKVLALLEVLLQYRNREDMKCIVFVKRIITAQLLAEIINCIEVLRAWKSEFLVGYHSGLKAMSRAKMKNIVENFRSGKVNLLVTTNVAEEGLDIQTCSLVVRFDLPNTVASFIQSRGRARMLESEYIFLVERGNFAEEQLVRHFVSGEEQMKREVQERTPEGVEPYEDEEDEIYKVDVTKATISTGCSVSLLYHYCSKLPKDEYSSLVPEFFYFEEPEGVKCRINLPSNAPIRQVSGPLCSSLVHAKRVACLEACKDLHSIGALTDYLLPGKDEEDEEDEDCCSPASHKPKGAEMSMELYEMLVPDVLKARLNRWTKPILLHSYLLKFDPIPPDREYTQFALFLESPLPKEAEALKVELHLARGRFVYTELIPCESLEFDPFQLRDALKFQEVYLRIMLDRPDFIKDHVALGMEDVNTENSSTSYFLLPVQSCDGNGGLSIEWNIIKDCLSSPIFSCTCQDLHTTTDNDVLCKKNGSLRLANGWVPMEIIQNSLVLTIHNNTFYCIVDILDQINSNSNFRECNYAEYFKNKHNVTLEYKEQPLLKAKQLLSLHNLLHDRSQVNVPSQVNQDGTLEEYFVELPAELCCIKLKGFSSHLASAISLLPSFMHRLENFLVAIELKELLSQSFPEGPQITSSRVLEAITTERCMEGFSLERLEVLGDSFLKYSVSRHLFLLHDKLDEGQLTKKRSNVIKNSNLYKKAIEKGFEKYIRDKYFDPKQYFALGRPCKEICTPETLNRIHYVEGDIMKAKADGASVKCSKRHHWMHTKTVADVVEALIGAYLVESDFKAALAFLNWIGIEVEFDPSLIESICIASRNSLSLMDSINISGLEGLIRHNFMHKGLLLEAFTHPTYNEHNGGCYQRLEFLGDAVLDYIITSYLYSVYPDLNPGYLTDMRSMTVNNESFANVTVRHSLYKYLIHKADGLSCDVEKYASFIRTFPNKNLYGGLELKCPKVLGDLVESFAGALLIDSAFDLKYVWKLMLELLEPIVTPETLRLQPVRELTEICQHHDLKLEYGKDKKKNDFLLQAKVSGKNVSVVGVGLGPNTNVAKKCAAQDAVTKLKAKGFVHPNKNLETFIKTCRRKDAVLIGNDKTERQSSEIMMIEKQTLDCKSPEAGAAKDPDETNLDFFPRAKNTLAEHEHCQPFLENNTLPTIENGDNTQNMFSLNSTVQELADEDEHLKSHRYCELANIPAENQSTSARYYTDDSQSLGSAISILNEFFQKLRWELPVWVCYKEEGLPHQRSFTYMVVMRLPEEVSVECLGDPMRSKKLAMASAARGALWWLKSEGYF